MFTGAQELGFGRLGDRPLRRSAANECSPARKNWDSAGTETGRYKRGWENSEKDTRLLAARENENAVGLVVPAEPSPL